MKKNKIDVTLQVRVSESDASIIKSLAGNNVSNWIREAIKAKISYHREMQNSLYVNNQQTA